MSEENQAIIKALNMYGRVPKQWELLNEIEKLHSIIKEIENYVNKTHMPEGYKKYILQVIKENK